MAIFSLIQVGKIFKFKSFFNQLAPRDFAFTFRVGIQQYPPVFTKGIVDISHDVVAVAVEAIVESTSTLIGAEFFIGATHDLIAAFNTFGVHVNKYKG